MESSSVSRIGRLVGAGIITLGVYLSLACPVFSAAPAPAPAEGKRVLELLQIAGQKLESKQNESAIRTLEEAQALAPDDANVKKMLATALNNEAVKKGDAGQTREAEELYDRALQIAPDPSMIRYNRGRMLGRIGRVEEAISDLMTALEPETLAKKEIVEARVAIADLHLKRQMFDDVIQNAEMAIGVEPKHIDAHYLLAQGHYRKGNHKAALEAIDALLALSPPTDIAVNVKKWREKLLRESKIEGEFQTQENSHFILQFDGGRRDDLVRGITDALEAAYTDVTGRLGYTPEGQIPVIIYTKKEFSDASQAPDWAGALYDGKMRIPVPAGGQVSDRFKETLTHELTHALVTQASSGKAPTWMQEGLAQMMEGKSFAADAKEVLMRDPGKDLSTRDLEGGFTSMTDRKMVNRAYGQSLAQTDRLVEKYGMNAIVEMLELMKGGMSPEDALKDKIYKGYPEIDKELKEELR